MPPLLLEDEEAVAVAVSLRTASGGAVSGMEESALRALTKLQQVLPKRLGLRVDALQSHTARVAPYSRGPAVDGGLLTLLAEAARDRELVRFDYSDRSGQGSERKVEPYRLVNWGRRWYLVAFDPQRDDWRTFRVDRLRETRSTGHRFRLRDLPAEDVATWVASKIRAVQQQATGKVLVRLPAGDVVRPARAVAGGRRRRAARRRRVPGDHGSAARHADLAFWLGVLDADFEVVDSPELAEAVERLAARYARAARMSGRRWPAINARRLDPPRPGGAVARRHDRRRRGRCPVRRARADPVGRGDLGGDAGRRGDAEPTYVVPSGRTGRGEDLRPARAPCTCCPPPTWAGGWPRSARSRRAARSPRTCG